MLIEKGTELTLPINALHLHPDYYPNAEQFDPSRFDRSFDSAKKLKDAGVFIPFGNGPRSCMGTSYKLFLIGQRTLLHRENFIELQE